MIDSLKIYTKATDLVKQCRTQEPIRLASELGITLKYTEYFEKLLGMYTYKWRNRIIILNSKMDEEMERMVLAHELGHDAFHRDLAKSDGLKEFVLFNMKDTTEYEANVFAAHILLNDDEIFKLAKQGYDIVQIAKMMNTNVNLVLIKLQELNKLGYDFRLPQEADGYFFRRADLTARNEL